VDGHTARRRGGHPAIGETEAGRKAHPGSMKPRIRGRLKKRIFSPFIALRVQGNGCDAFCPTGSSQAEKKEKTGTSIRLSGPKVAESSRYSGIFGVGKNNRDQAILLKLTTIRPSHVVSLKRVHDEEGFLLQNSYDCARNLGRNAGLDPRTPNGGTRLSVSVSEVVHGGGGGGVGGGGGGGGGGGRGGGKQANGVLSSDSSRPLLKARAVRTKKTDYWNECRLHPALAEKA